MRAKEYDVLTRAVEEGVAYGWNRAYKHTTKPDPDQAREEIYQAVVNSICEVFDFHPYPEEEEVK
jgi:hypothetical protein